MKSGFRQGLTCDKRKPTSSKLGGYGQMWQTEGPTRAPALRWAWTRGAQEARSRPVWVDTVRGPVMESGGRQGATRAAKTWQTNMLFILRKMVRH